MTNGSDLLTRTISSTSIHKMTWSPDGEMLATCSSLGRSTSSLSTSTRDIYWLCFIIVLEFGMWIRGSSLLNSEMQLRLKSKWDDIKNLLELGLLILHFQEFYSVKFSPDSKLIFTCGKLKDRHSWSQVIALIFSWMYYLPDQCAF